MDKELAENFPIDNPSPDPAPPLPGPIWPTLTLLPWLPSPLAKTRAIPMMPPETKFLFPLVESRNGSSLMELTPTPSPIST